jgi:hypothetical protein
VYSSLSLRAMSSSEERDPFELLEEKISAEVQGGHPYEAFQLAMSFVARKRKTFGKSKTSALVFHACKILLQHNASSDAVSLLAWFIEDGAGEDYFFKLEEGDLSGDNYCDSQRLIELLASFPYTTTFQLVEKIYGPIHKLALKKRVGKSGSLADRLHTLELTWINIFEANKSWHVAYKALVRIGDMDRAARVLNSWAQEGYTSEHPLFFARAVLQLLSDGQLAKAEELIKKSAAYVNDSDDVAPTDPRAAYLALYHFSVILSNLASMEPKPRVDKLKIYGLLTSRYSALIQKIDPKLILLFEKIGQNAFGLKPAEQTNPMAAIFQNMMAAGAANKPGTGAAKKKKQPGLDFNAMMNMMNALQGPGSK